MPQKSPANSKAKIFVGDTYTKSFEHRIVSAANPNSAGRGVPGTVTNAVARLYDVANTVYLPIGGAGVFEVACTITPATADVGTIVSYTVDSVWTAAPGDFALFITYTYENNQVETLKYRFRVVDKR